MIRILTCSLLTIGVLSLLATSPANAQYPLYGNYYGQPGAQANRIYQHYGNQGAQVFGYYHNMGARAFGWQGSQPYSNYYGTYGNRRYSRYQRW